MLSLKWQAHRVDHSAQFSLCQHSRQVYIPAKEESRVSHPRSSITRIPGSMATAESAWCRRQDPTPVSGTAHSPLRSLRSRSPGCSSRWCRLRRRSSRAPACTHCVYTCRAALVELRCTVVEAVEGQVCRETLTSSCPLDCSASTNSWKSRHSPQPPVPAPGVAPRTRLAHLG